MNDCARPRRAATPHALAAAVLLAFAHAAAADEATLWQRLRADPRTAHLAALPAQEPRAFVRDHGVENRLPPSGSHSTIGVTNCNDAGSGSLREAVAIAASGDTVETIALTCGTITLTTGTITVAQGDLTLKGRGPDALTITANDASRVFTHTGTGTLQIYGMTLAHGLIATADATPALGGCVYSRGQVVLGDFKYRSDRQHGVVARNCMARAQATGSYAGGGAVFARRGLALFASVVSGNVASGQGQADARGGGVALARAPGAAAYGSFTAMYSEIRDNQASVVHGNGGGIYAYAAQIDLVNATISGNRIDGNAAVVTDGGGAFLRLAAAGTAQIVNTTVSGNVNAKYGIGGLEATGGQSILVANSTITVNTNYRANAVASGAYLSSASVELESSIFCGNDPSSGDVNVHTTGASVSGANNLVGGGVAPVAGLVSCANASLVLAPLANNGGLTRTHALLPGSAAIDAGNNSQNLATDQRGPAHPRVLGVAADIGAYERDPDLIFRNGFD